MASFLGPPRMIPVNYYCLTTAHCYSILQRLI